MIINQIASGGGGGLDTFDATAYPEHLLKDYTAYARGAKITGTYEPTTYDEYTKALLHFDGGRGTTFVDETGKIWTPNANAVLSSTQKGYGDSSFFCNANSLIPTPYSDDFAFGSGDFTIDFWFYPNTVSYDRHNFYGHYDDAGQYIQISMSDTNFVYFQSIGGTLFTIQTGVQSSIVANRWQHFAIVRSGTTYFGFVNGIQLSTGTYSGNVPVLTQPIVIGARKYAAVEDRYVNGYIDEFRVSKGIARWTTNFIPGSAYGKII